MASHKMTGQIQNIDFVAACCRDSPGLEVMNTEHVMMIDDDSMIIA